MEEVRPRAGNIASIRSKWSSDWLAGGKKDPTPEYEDSAREYYYLAFIRSPLYLYRRGPRHAATIAVALSDNHKLLSVPAHYLQLTVQIVGKRAR